MSKRKSESSETKLTKKKPKLGQSRKITICARFVASAKDQWLDVDSSTAWGEVQDRLGEGRLLFVNPERQYKTEPIGGCARVGQSFYGACAETKGHIMIKVLPICLGGGPDLEHYCVSPIPDMSAGCRLDLYGQTYALQKVSAFGSLGSSPTQQLGFSFQHSSGGYEIDLAQLQVGFLWKTKWCSELDDFDIAQPVSFDVVPNPYRGRAQLLIQQSSSHRQQHPTLCIFSMAGFPEDIYNKSVLRATHFCNNKQRVLLPCLIDIICGYAAWNWDNEQCTVWTTTQQRVHVVEPPAVCIVW